ncbi:DUF3263 domain-containing protein [Corynebacterium sanguinis]|uniref:DUF3263 domain-containing protein n=2 Tax=Corynebacteriaceae TaxID=1653 RepID=C0XP16_CORLD|nr:hypothetical protein HMPREF0298_0186 [Corynebacterium lipophiloflavum DSM 44291]TVS25509.1 DUF3263 domain-containing protein [Corynebacterium sanguinis]
MLNILGMLTDADLTLLDFEATAPRSVGAKEDAIRSVLGLTPIRYYQRLNVLLDSSEALAARPQLVRRLQRVRDRSVG